MRLPIRKRKQSAVHAQQQVPAFLRQRPLLIPSLLLGHRPDQPGTAHLQNALAAPPPVAVQQSRAIERHKILLVDSPVPQEKQASARTWPISMNSKASKRALSKLSIKNRGRLKRYSTRRRFKLRQEHGVRVHAAGAVRSPVLRKA